MARPRLGHDAGMTELDPEAERERLQHIEEEIAEGRRHVAENDSNLPHGETYAEPEETEDPDAAEARKRRNDREDRAEDAENGGKAENGGNGEEAEEDVDDAIVPPG